jgi:hypothetical protein
MIYFLFDKLDSYRKLWKSWKKRRKIFSVNSGLKNIELNNKTVKAYKNIWSSFGNPSSKWLKMYAGINNNCAPEYVPESYYYTTIESKLNNKIYALAYADKNFYDILLSKAKDLFPKVFLRKINGVLYDRYYTAVSLNKAASILYSLHNKYFVLKPSSGSAGGRKVLILNKDNGQWFYNGKKMNLERINEFYYDNFILQEKVEQHNFFKRLNESSVNTVRIFTYRSVSDNDIHILHSIIRIGRPGEHVDNQASGGFSIGMDHQGFLNDFAIDKYGNKTYNINNIRLSGLKQVPGIQNMKKTAKEIAPYFFYNRVLAFDFCLDTNENVRLLEVNLQNIEINFLQMNNGPLFGNFTREIIDYCKYAKKSLNFDFYV